MMEKCKQTAACRNASRESNYCQLGQSRLEFCLNVMGARLILPE